ncbi:hypothetical protein GALMADRAFT_216032 [Galerina marginata CBS 339.88]|uniref:Uncharacterized protein n=1 Tax=Galerina marginata (strain CBS 339.88) TaxID=685588 RepID=A0A067SDQ9_GALM3|nr:hypothetical protein GALMADRAFT_216032 [Galerina marginata CBS 339.88]
MLFPNTVVPNVERASAHLLSLAILLSRSPAVWANCKVFEAVGQFDGIGDYSFGVWWHVRLSLAFKAFSCHIWILWRALVLAVGAKTSLVLRLRTILGTKKLKAQHEVMAMPRARHRFWEA